MSQSQPQDPERGVELTDEELSAFARDAGRRAHDRDLAVSGEVTKAEGNTVVVERRDGSVEVLREMPAPYAIPVGTVLTRRLGKGGSRAG